MFFLLRIGNLFSYHCFEIFAVPQCGSVFFHQGGHWWTLTVFSSREYYMLFFFDLFPFKFVLSLTPIIQILYLLDWYSFLSFSPSIVLCFLGNGLNFISNFCSVYHFCHHIFISQECLIFCCFKQFPPFVPCMQYFLPENNEFLNKVFF